MPGMETAKLGLKAMVERHALSECEGDFIHPP